MMRNALYIGREWNVEHDRRAQVSDAELRYAVLGEGEPVLSIEGGAQHARELLDHLGIEKAHIMAFSFGGVIAFQFLLSYPERAHSAILLEPYLPREEPDTITANVDAFMNAMKLYETGDKLGAAQLYMEAVCGPSFLPAVEMTGPLDVWDRVEQCVDTTFADFPAISQWGFKPSDAAVPHELAAAGRAGRHPQRHARDVEHEPGGRGRGRPRVPQAPPHVRWHTHPCPVRRPAGRGSAPPRRSRSRLRR
ncbi:alpha/beta hydrolase [Nonomuraea sp. NBC_00507]|uniref:alpha/beta fold hydrolase n=1 Tax=Nonomuraea sp. NBC_00507 TaxID=2976002 RepID=UPI002E176927